MFGCDSGSLINSFLLALVASLDLFCVVLSNGCSIGDCYTSKDLVEDFGVILFDVESF